MTFYYSNPKWESLWLKAPPPSKKVDGRRNDAVARSERARLLSDIDKWWCHEWRCRVAISSPSGQIGRWKQSGACPNRCQDSRIQIAIRCKIILWSFLDTSTCTESCVSFTRNCVKFFESSTGQWVIQQLLCSHVWKNCKRNFQKR